MANQTVEYTAKATPPTAPTRNGYAFGGWYSDSGLTTAYNFSTVVTANLPLYAKWTAIYTVSFNSDGGSTVASRRWNMAARLRRLPFRRRTGYTFLGWYSDSSLTNGYNFTTPVTGNLTLYAKWTFNSSP